MVDYSKWDSFGDDLSDSDEDRKPTVTKLNDRSKVHIGPNGVTITADDVVKSSSLSEKCTTLVTIKKSSNKSKNGGKTDSFDWSQDRYEVLIQASLPLLPSGARVPDITLKYDVESQILEFSLDKLILLGGTLRYPIEGLAEDIDWEMKRINTDEHEENVLHVTLRKKVVIANATIWWSCVFVGDPEIDLASIEGRDKSLSAPTAWAQAHAMFKDRISKRELIEVDTNDEAQEESDL